MINMLYKDLWMGTKCTRDIQQYFRVKIGSLDMKSLEVANKTISWWEKEDELKKKKIFNKKK